MVILQTRGKLFSLVLLGLLAAVSASYADRPRCYEILPKRTLAYLRVADVQEMVEKLEQTSMGKMFEVEEMQSLTSRLFEEAESAFEPVADEIGLTMRQLLAIPSGEVTIAAVAPPSGGEVTAPVLMIDVEGQRPNMMKLVELMENGLREQGRVKTTKAERGTALNIFEDEDTRWTGVIHFQKDNLQVFTTNLEIAKQILAAWDGDEKQPTLEANEDFAKVMRHSKGPKEAVPHIRWFIDPISLAKVSLRGNTAAQGGLAFLPILGVDGILALGGSMTFASDEYDSFSQTHMITAEPRTGVLAALAMKSGDPTPESWVPNDAASYQTLYWDLETTEREASQLYNSFAGADAFQNGVLNRANEFLGLDVMEEVVKQMAGRFSMATYFTRPVSISSQTLIAGLKLKADHNFAETFDSVMEKVGTELEKKSYGGFTYYFTPAQEEEEAPDPNELGNPFRPAQGQFAIGVVGDYVLMANKVSAIEKAIITRSSKKSLSKELDFKLVASKLRRQPGGRTPGWFAFNRPEQGLRMIYEMATAQGTRDMLARNAENNEGLGRLNRVLEENPLPPFAKLKQFLAPAGSIATVDKQGFHMIGFGLKRK